MPVFGNTLIRYSLAWVLLALVAIGNGLLRESTYGHWVGELAAHQISTVTGMLLVGATAWGVLMRWPTATTSQAWLVGTLWLIQTVCFELLFGHYVAGHSWSRLLNDYNIAAGRIWLLLLLLIWLMPPVFHRSARNPLEKS